MRPKIQDQGQEETCLTQSQELHSSQTMLTFRNVVTIIIEMVLNTLITIDGIMQGLNKFICLYFILYVPSLNTI